MVSSVLRSSSRRTIPSIHVLYGLHRFSVLHLPRHRHPAYNTMPSAVRGYTAAHIPGGPDVTTWTCNAGCVSLVQHSSRVCPLLSQRARSSGSPDGITLGGGETASLSVGRNLYMRRLIADEHDPERQYSLPKIQIPH